MAHIFQLNLSNGGVPKGAVREARLGAEGLEGDWQKQRRFHGGPLRALCLYPLEQIVKLQAEGHPIYPGSVGENVTTVGLEWAEIVPGRRLALGEEAVIEITSYTVPCQTIAGSFLDGKSGRISQKTHPGEARVYARVIRPGLLRAGQAVFLLGAGESS
ncbi:MAG TPA: MOSC domain-containing protein [Pyrinomonadaceae bacterium]|nr:MOSC domain-containing protein [Pyrinomonadaceae bacterium]